MILYIQKPEEQQLNIYSRVGTTLKHWRTPLEITQTDKGGFWWSCREMSKVYHLDEVKSSFARLNLARGYCHQVFLLWHDNISVPVGFWRSCFTILLTFSRVFKRTESWWWRPLLKPGMHGACVCFAILQSCFLGIPVPLDNVDDLTNFMKMLGRMGESQHLHNVRVTAMTATNTGDGDKVAGKGKGRSKSLSTCLLRCSSTAPLHEKILVLLKWGHNSPLRFSLSPPFVHSVLLSSALSRGSLLSRWHFQKAAETSWCFHPAQKKEGKMRHRLLGTQLSSNNDHLIRFTSH